MGDANLVLMGLRGSGKSTLGAALARRLGRTLVDVDALTAERLGVGSAAAAFATVGEAGFREAEALALSDALTLAGRVVALGGGTPTAPGAAVILRRERAAGRAWVVYLHAGAEELRRRLAGTDFAQRPGLLGDDPLAEIERLYQMRDGLYRSLADAIVEVTGRSVEDVAGEIEGLA